MQAFHIKNIKVCAEKSRDNIIDGNLFDMSDIGKYKYHIDHIVSLRECYDNNISPFIASCHFNMRKLWWSDNIKKHKYNDIITLRELLFLYTTFT